MMLKALFNRWFGDAAVADTQSVEYDYRIRPAPLSITHNSGQGGAELDVG